MVRGLTLSAKRANVTRPTKSSLRPGKFAPPSTKRSTTFFNAVSRSTARPFCVKSMASMELDRSTTSSMATPSVSVEVCSLMRTGRAMHTMSNANVVARSALGSQRNFAAVPAPAILARLTTLKVMAGWLRRRHKRQKAAKTSGKSSNIQASFNSK